MQLKKSFNRTAKYITAVLFLLVWLSCNPYKHIANRPPLTPKDSAALLSRCIAISPLDTNTTHFFPQLPTLPDSVAYFKALGDSLLLVRQTVRERIKTQYKDTCTSVPYLYEDGFNTGFDAGYYDAKSTAEKMYQSSYRIADSLHRLEIFKLKSDYNLRLIAAVNSENIALKETEKYRLKYESWQQAFIWAAGLAGLFLIIAILLWKFRRQTKAANNIINDVKDLK